MIPAKFDCNKKQAKYFQYATKVSGQIDSIAKL